MATKPIRYCNHLKGRLTLRGIAHELPTRIIQDAERVFSDTETGYKVVVAPGPFRGGTHLMMVVFEEREDEIVAVTIHPLDSKNIDAKFRSGNIRRHNVKRCHVSRGYHRVVLEVLSRTGRL